MKIKLIISLAIMPLIFAFSADRGMPGHTSANVFEIAIFQNSQKMEINNHTVHLKKAPFQFVITLHNTSEIAMSASFRDNIVKKMQTRIPLKRMDWFGDGDGLSQSPKNAGRDFYIAESGFNYCCYLPDEMNVFDDVKITDQGAVCTRSIDSIDIIKEVCGLKHLSYEANSDGSIPDIPVGKIIESKIFLAFINWENSSDGETRIEKQRDWLEIDFD